MDEYGFFEHMGFKPELIREARAFYVPMFDGCESVLDVACGRGEFLDALGRGSGVDIEERMVASAREAGHEVVLGDAFDHLQRNRLAYDGIFSAHFIEHLPYERAADLVRLAWEALRPGGVLVICTPNAASLPTLQRQFWWDATHVRMYDVELLRFMLIGVGFGEVEGGENPRNTPGCPIDLDALTVPSIEAIEPPRLMRRVFKLLDRRTQVTHHQLSVVSNSLRGLVEALYTPSEIFVRGRKPRFPE
jgi:SAM-dependent methyltransferase